MKTLCVTKEVLNCRLHNLPAVIACGHTGEPVFPVSSTQLNIMES
jgi:hypothetical protein